MKPHDFSDFDAWSRSATEAGYEGPKQMQGHQQFDFTRDGQVVAQWNGMEGTGVVHLEDEPAPAPAIAEESHVDDESHAEEEG